MPRSPVKDIVDAKKNLTEELKLMGMNVSAIEHLQFGTGNVFMMTIDHEIHSIENRWGANNYVELAAMMHNKIEILAPENWQFAVVDTGDNSLEESYILAIYSD